MAKVAGIPGEHFQEAGENYDRSESSKICKSKKKGKGTSAFLLEDIRWEEFSLQIIFLTGPIYCYLV